MPEEFNADKFYRTSDMAMATYLRMEGHTPQNTEWEDSTCYWIFRTTDGLLEMTDRFANDEALVNPKIFNREFARTRQEFHRNGRSSAR